MAETAASPDDESQEEPMPELTINADEITATRSLLGAVLAGA